MVYLLGNSDQRKHIHVWTQENTPQPKHALYMYTCVITLGGVDRKFQKNLRHHTINLSLLDVYMQCVLLLT